jgi:hypothetical protein
MFKPAGGDDFLRRGRTLRAKFSELQQEFPFSKPLPKRKNVAGEVFRSVRIRGFRV